MPSTARVFPADTRGVPKRAEGCSGVPGAGRGWGGSLWLWERALSPKGEYEPEAPRELVVFPSPRGIPDTKSVLPGHLWSRRVGPARYLRSRRWVLPSTPRPAGPKMAAAAKMEEAVRGPRSHPQLRAPA